MMNEHALPEHLAAEDVGQIQELTPAARQRQIQNRVPSAKAACDVSPRADQLPCEPQASGTLGSVEHVDAHSRLQPVEHHCADVGKAVNGRRQRSDESDALIHPTRLSKSIRRAGDPGGRRATCRTPSFADKRPEARQNDRYAATANPVAIIKDPRMTIIKNTDA